MEASPDLQKLSVEIDERFYGASDHPMITELRRFIKQIALDEQTDQRAYQAHCDAKAAAIRQVFPITQIRRLPTLPAICSRLVALIDTDSANISVGDIEQIIRQAPVRSSRQPSCASWVHHHTAPIAPS